MNEINNFYLAHIYNFKHSYIDLPLAMGIILVVNVVNVVSVVSSICSVSKQPSSSMFSIGQVLAV